MTGKVKRSPANISGEPAMVNADFNYDHEMLLYVHSILPVPATLLTLFLALSSPEPVFCGVLFTLYCIFNVGVTEIVLKYDLLEYYGLAMFRYAANDVFVCWTVVSGIATSRVWMLSIPCVLLSPFVFPDKRLVSLMSGITIITTGYARFFAGDDPYDVLVVMTAETTIVLVFTLLVARLRLTTEQLKENVAIMQQFTSSKSSFLATMSHELRTPINGVIGMTAVLLDTALDAEQWECVGTIQRCGRQLVTLINDSLDLTKIQTGKLRLESIAFSWDTLLRDIRIMLKDKIESKNLRFSLSLHADLRTAFQGDPSRLSQVLLNLAGNAVKFTSLGGVDISVFPISSVYVPTRANASDGIDVMFSPKEDVVAEVYESTPTRIRVEVQDTGIGMAPSAKHTIFSAFAQADSSTTRMYGGTGLGLSICKELIGHMGGHIGVSSVQGSGSCFWFEIELCRSDAPVHESNVSALQSFHSARNLKVISSSSSEASPMLDVRRVPVPVGADSTTVSGGSSSSAGSTPSMVIKSLHTMPRKKTKKMSSHVPRNRSNELVDDDDYNESCVGVAESKGPVMKRRKRKPTRAKQQPESPCPVRAFSKSFPVVVVDDNLINRQVLNRFLTKDGWEVVLLDGGKKAVDRVMSGTSCGVLMMDCHMPVLDGYEATQCIREWETEKFGVVAKGTPMFGPHRVPVVACTANTLMGDREKCLDAGMDDFVTKPIDRERMLAMVTKLMTCMYETHTAAAELVQQLSLQKANLASSMENIASLLAAGVGAIEDAVLASGGDPRVVEQSLRRRNNVASHRRKSTTSLMWETVPCQEVTKQTAAGASMYGSKMLNRPWTAHPSPAPSSRTVLRAKTAHKDLLSSGYDDASSDFSMGSSPVGNARTVLGV